jgi:hypothetical protein
MPMNCLTFVWLQAPEEKLPMAFTRINNCTVVGSVLQ